MGEMKVHILHIQTKYETSIVRINAYFCKYGSEMYKINPGSLFDWNKLYEAYKARLLDDSEFNKIDEDVYFDFTKDNLSIAIDRFEQYLNDDLYSILIHEPDALKLWENVKNTLKKWINK